MERVSDIRLLDNEELADTVVDIVNPYVELESRILQRIVECTGGRIRQPQVNVSGDGVCVEGRVSSYHVKQMAIRGLMEVIEHLPIAPRSIETAIEVVSPPRTC